MTTRRYFDVTVAINSVELALTVGYQMIPEQNKQAACVQARWLAQAEHGGSLEDWKVERAREVEA